MTLDDIRDGFQHSRQERLTSPNPHQTGRAVFPHPAFRILFVRSHDPLGLESTWTPASKAHSLKRERKIVELRQGLWNP